MTSSNADQSVTMPYHKPQLEVYGAIKKLTAGGSGTNQENKRIMDQIVWNVAASRGTDRT